MDEIISFIADRLAVICKIDSNEISAESDLFYDIGVDSLDVVELLTDLEDRYGYYIPDSELIQMHTVEDIAQSIANAINR